MKLYLSFLAIVLVLMSINIEISEADGYGHGHGHGHGHSAKGTSCIVKGSYCNCHYCKCEKGHVHCGGYGKGGHGKSCQIDQNIFCKIWRKMNLSNLKTHYRKVCLVNLFFDFCKTVLNYCSFRNQFERLA